MLRSTLLTVTMIFGLGFGHVAFAQMSSAQQPTPTCEEVAKTAKTACLTPGTAGMKPGEAAMYTRLVNQLVQTGTQMAAMGKNMAGQCSLQANVSEIMTGINTVKGGACWVYIEKCEETCTLEKADNEAKIQIATNPDTQKHFRDLARLNDRTIKTCADYSGQVAEMAAGAIAHLGNFAINNQCAKDLAAYDAQLAAQKPIELPTIGDCSDPNNQSLTCFCQKDANAKSPMCAGFSPGSLTGGGSVVSVPNGMKGGSSSSPYASTAGEDADNTQDPFANGQAKSSGGGSAPGDGGSGAPGGGGLSSLASEGGGGGGGGDPRSAITGTSGGNSSGLGGVGGGGAGGLARNGGGGGGDSQSFMDKFNLKKFLPTSKYKTRGIAGMSVKSVDGITGPTGPSIWEKATRQYQEQIQKQNVLLDR